MATNTQKVAYNTFISTLARVLATILAIIIVGLSTRYLGENGFGQYVTILAYLYIFSVLSDFGLYSIVVRDISREGADEKKIVSVAFTIRLFVGVISFVLASLFVWLLPYDNVIKSSIPVASAGFLALSVTQVLMGIFQKYLRMDLASLGDLFGRATQLALVWLVVRHNLGFAGIINALVGGSVATLLLSLVFARKFIKISLDIDLVYWKKTVLESYPLAISAVLVMIYFKADTIMLSLMKPLGDVGIYGVAYRIMENLIFFPAMFTGLVIPQMAKSFQRDNARFVRIIQKSFNFFVIIAILIIGGTLALSPRIISLIAGRGFDSSAGVLNILVFALFFIFFGSLFGNIILVVGKQKELAKIYLTGAVTNVAANLILIPRYSYTAAAFTTLLTEAVVTMLMVWVTYKTIRYIPSLERLGKAIIASALMVAVIHAISFLNILLLIILSPVIYFVILFLIKGITREEIAELLNRRV